MKRKPNKAEKVGQYLYEGGFSIMAGKYDEFAQWCKKNGVHIRRACPKGMEFVGIFMVRQTSEKDAGDFRIIWRLDSYSSVDRFQIAIQPRGALHELMVALGSFCDRGGSWSQITMQDMEMVPAFLFYK